MKAAIYARYSTDLQSDSSIEDQIRVCTNYAKKNDFDVVSRFSDNAASGSTINRKGIQNLVASASSFDVVITESLDRLSRNQAHIAQIYNKLSFEGVKIFTLEDGEVNELHIGLKGTFSAIFLKQLAAKTHRGLRGMIEKGKFAGGKCFGYDTVKRIDSNGDLIKGEREINLTEAEIVRRIFKEYAYLDKSPKAIASQLNLEGIPGPSGNTW